MTWLLQLLGKALGDAGGFARYALRRFISDGCLTGAGALSYTSLISLVPLTAIALASFSAFPIFEGARDQLFAFVLKYLVPELTEEAEYWFKYFTTSAAHTTAIGVVALAVTAILLLMTIEDQLNVIWKVTTHRPWLQRILVYWTLLTLGPILLAASLSLSGYFDKLAFSAGLDAARLNQLKEAWFYRVSDVVPFLLETLTLTLLYLLVPNTAVRWREAFSGALIGAAAIELLKLGFNYYIRDWSTYSTVYGALAAIPIFLLWMYLLWGAVLLGSVVAAALPQWRADEDAPPQPDEGRPLGLSLALLGELMALARGDGGSRRTEELADRLAAPASAIDEQLCELCKSGFVVQAANGGWALGRDLGTATVLDLYKALGLPLAVAWRDGTGQAAWQQRVAPAMQRLAAAEAGAMRIPLDALLGSMAAPRLVSGGNAPR
jgi:membrane protein